MLQQSPMVTSFQCFGSFIPPASPGEPAFLPLRRRVWIPGAFDLWSRSWACGLQAVDEGWEAFGEGLEEFGAGGVGSEVEGWEEACGGEGGAFGGEGFAQA